MNQIEWPAPRKITHFIVLVAILVTGNLQSIYRSHAVSSSALWPEELASVFNSTRTLEETQTKVEQSLSTAIPSARKTNVLPEESNSASQRWVQVAVVSDRKTNAPFMGLFHSILMYTTAPVIFHIFTEHPYAFLDGIEKKTPYVRVYYYSNAANNERAARLVQESKFITIHHASTTSMSRLFIGQSPFQPIGTIPKVIVVDDDILFYRDISELWKIVMVNQSNISLFCPKDNRRMRRWLRGKRRANGDREGGRYCQGGLMALPVAAYPGAVNSSKYFWDATFDMTAQFPNYTYHLAHQQILNRMFVKHKSTIDIIPCNWHGDTHTCKRPKKCNCEGESFTYHFLEKAYKKKPDMFYEIRPSWAFSYYMNTTLDSILPALNERIREKNGF